MEKRKEGRKGVRKNGKRFPLAVCGLAAVICVGCGGSMDGMVNSSPFMESGSSHEWDVSYSEAAADAVGGSFSDGVGSFGSNGSGSSYGKDNSFDSSSFGGNVGGNGSSLGNSGGQISGSETDEGVTTGRKLIKTVDLEIETKEFGQMMSALEEQIQQMGGYIESMDAYNGSSYSAYSNYRYANMTIRIPVGQLDGFLENVSGIGNIVRRYDNVDDVTLSYVDMEGRRDTLRTEQSRLLAFLDKAESIEDILIIEERLSEVRYQLESMESKLRTMDSLLEYSTVKMNITEVKELSPVTEQTAWERVKEGFSASLFNIGNGVMEFAIWFVVHIPYLIIWAVFITIIVFSIKIFRKKRRRKKEGDDQ